MSKTFDLLQLCGKFNFLDAINRCLYESNQTALAMKFTLTFAPQKREAIVGSEFSQLGLQLKIAKIRGDSLTSFQIILDKDTEWVAEGLIAYFNANRAWLIWNNEDDEWLYPVNFRHDKLEDIEEKCYIENGQLDRYSIRWCHSHDFALKLLERYFNTGERAPWVKWTSEEYWMT